MNTSGYIIELIIAGAGAVVWILLFTFAILGYDWVPVDFLIEPGVVIMLSPFVYVIGVITDRLVDSVFEKYFSENPGNPLFMSQHEYVKAITQVYMAAESLKELFEYNKRRIRICRAWSFNSLMIMFGAILLIILPHTPFTEIIDRFLAILTILIVFGISSYLSFRAWRSLSVKKARFLSTQCKVLDELISSPFQPLNEEGSL